MRHMPKWTISSQVPKVIDYGKGSTTKTLSVCTLKWVEMGDTLTRHGEGEDMVCSFRESLKLRVMAREEG